MPCCGVIYLVTFEDLKEKDTEKATYCLKKLCNHFVESPSCFEGLNASLKEDILNYFNSYLSSSEKQELVEKLPSVGGQKIA